MKPIKKTMFALISFLAITLLIFWFLKQTIKPELLKQVINTRLSSFTAQRCQIDGTLTWHLFPKPSVSISKIRIGEDNPSTRFSLLIGDLRLSLQIMPLFTGNLVFNEMNIDGLTLRINPNSPAQQPKQDSGLRSLKTAKQFQSSETKAQYAINRFLLTHGRITVGDGDQQTTLAGVQIVAEQLNLSNEVFPFQCKAKLSTPLSTGNLTASLSFKGNSHVSSYLLSNPLKAMQENALNGQLIVQNLHAKALTIPKVTANVMTNDGAIRLDPLNITLYGGESIGDLAYHFTSKKLSLNQTATGLNAETVSKELLHTKVISGDLDFSLHTLLSFHEDDWINSLQGNGNVTVKNGTLNAINLDKLLGDITHSVTEFRQNKSLSQITLPVEDFRSEDYLRGNSAFQLLSVQYDLAGLTLTSNPILLQTDTLHVSGKGQFNLKNCTIETMSANVVTTDAALNKIQTLIGGGFPIKLSGDMAHPKILPDIEKITLSISRSVLKRTIEKTAFQFLAKTFSVND